jgi:hypothetical protein
MSWPSGCPEIGATKPILISRALVWGINCHAATAETAIINMTTIAKIFFCKVILSH